MVTRISAYLSAQPVSVPTSRGRSTPGPPSASAEIAASTVPTPSVPHRAEESAAAGDSAPGACAPPRANASRSGTPRSFPVKYAPKRKIPSATTNRSPSTQKSPLAQGYARGGRKRRKSGRARQSLARRSPRGRSTEKVMTPEAYLLAMRPLWRVTIALAVDRPMPYPPVSRAREESAR